MFLGHFAVAFAVQKIVPKVSLGLLFIGVQFDAPLFSLSPRNLSHGQFN